MAEFKFFIRQNYGQRMELKKITRQGENIYKWKDGRWEGRYKCGYSGNKAKYRSVYAHTYQEVKEKLQKLKSDNNSFISSGKRTVRELCMEWLTSVKLRVKQSTYACYQLKLNKYILPVFGGLVYNKLTVSSIHKFIENKLKEGLSAKYVSVM